MSDRFEKTINNNNCYDSAGAEGTTGAGQSGVRSQDKTLGTGDLDHVSGSGISEEILKNLKV